MFEVQRAQLCFWRPKFALRHNKNKLADLRSSAQHAHLCSLPQLTDAAGTYNYACYQTWSNGVAVEVSGGSIHRLALGDTGIPAPGKIFFYSECQWMSFLLPPMLLACHIIRRWLPLHYLTDSTLLAYLSVIPIFIVLFDRHCHSPSTVPVELLYLSFCDLFLFSSYWNYFLLFFF
jgi:hypothetical protein